MEVSNDCVTAPVKGNCTLPVSDAGDSAKGAICTFSMFGAGETLGIERTGMGSGKVKGTVGTATDEKGVMEP